MYLFFWKVYFCVLIFHSNLNVVGYNVNGIGETDKCTKILNRFIYTSLGEMPNICAFQELKMNVLTVNTLVLKLKGYKTFIDIILGNAAKKLPAKGGVMLAFKKSTNFKILNNLSHEGWCILIKCKVNGKVFVFGNVHLPPENAKEYSEKLDKLDELLSHLKCDNVILCGDFNCSFSEADNSKHWSEAHWARAPFLLKFVEKWELQDSWRLHYQYD